LPEVELRLRVSSLLGSHLDRRARSGDEFTASEAAERGMESRDEAIARLLAKESEEFRREWAAHQRYEKILEEYNRRPHLAPDEEVERKKIQKLKLAGKDRMARMILAFRKQHPDFRGEGQH
jgi:hypothetical protein